MKSGKYIVHADNWRTWKRISLDKSLTTKPDCNRGGWKCDPDCLLHEHRQIRGLFYRPCTGCTLSQVSAPPTRPEVLETGTESKRRHYLHIFPSPNDFSSGFLKAAEMLSFLSLMFAFIPLYMSKPLDSLLLPPSSRNVTSTSLPARPSNSTLH